MMLVAIALTFSSIAAISGILAIGSGRHWQFKPVDYLRGKRNAILYLWVISSTIFSICHSGVILEYGEKYGWVLRTPDSWKWMVLHALMGILLTCAHIFVAYTLSKEVGPVDKYLWGARRRVHQL